MVHFGINTFIGKEWEGWREKPEIFNPPNVDTTQWVEVAKSFGAKAVIFTCKHHDGFCLWPTETTTFSVKNSPWREGKGDLVREVSEACRKAGIGFGVYLSPADLHEPSHGWETEKYNDFFCAQLRELLTGYSEVCQFFFDGATPGQRQQRFDWQRYYALIRELQPKAVISIMGPDVRWVGNESGYARSTEWSVIPLAEPAERHTWSNLMGQDLGSRAKVKDAKHLHWYPAVADVSLRLRWFWQPNTDYTIKSLDHLMRIYAESVGRNAGLQLNLSPDRTGRIPAPDVARLKEFGEEIKARFAHNLCAEPGARLEKDKEKTKDDGSVSTKQTITFQTALPVRYVVLQEDITQGQHIEQAEVTLHRANGETKTLPLTTVGYKRILKTGLPDVVQITVEVKDSRSSPHLTVAAY